MFTLQNYRNNRIIIAIIPEHAPNIPVMIPIIDSCLSVMTISTYLLFCKISSVATFNASAIAFAVLNEHVFPFLMNEMVAAFNPAFFASSPYVRLFCRIKS